MILQYNLQTKMGRRQIEVKHPPARNKSWFLTNKAHFLPGHSYIDSDSITVLSEDDNQLRYKNYISQQVQRNEVFVTNDQAKIIQTGYLPSSNEQLIQQAEARQRKKVANLAFTLPYYFEKDYASERQKPNLMPLIAAQSGKGQPIAGLLILLIIAVILFFAGSVLALTSSDGVLFKDLSKKEIDLQLLTGKQQS
ncbi:hypothetical protein FGO68_gene17361 [Halteria grandinella]|uniref:Uncharacterized protein n=1 Tax=Halteria grandinella TaxID=5974 RepID=A0A8J8NZ77_HALGN|nr:hypothetical protein FGO68_gene17361 [Halteria grandinella]